MPFFLIYIILLIVELILSLCVFMIEDRKKRRIMGLTAGAAIVGTLAVLANVTIPKPEIYTTNGTNITDNEVYITTEWPLTIKYTLIPYEDPQKEGIKYNDNIAIQETMTVSAKATLFGIKWSELVSKDIIVGNDGKIDIIETQEPGTSIKKINAYLINNHFFPGDMLNKEDIRVEGTTIAEEIVTIEDFNFSPDGIVEGTNNITVNYKNLSTNISYIASMPKLISINAEYIGDELHEGDILDTKQFRVIGIYEDGQQNMLESFSLNPSVAEKAGELNISIEAEELSTNITVAVLEQLAAFTLASELHTPNGSYDPKVYVSAWEKGTDYSIDGRTFDSGIKLTFDNWMSGLMGNGNDFAEGVESNLYIAVNQEVISKRSETEQFFSGQFVIERGTQGSPTTAEICILADGEEVYHSGEITAASTQIPSFRVSVKGISQLVIQTKANVCGNDFILGIVDE